jgi:hypothetical protein
MHCLHREQAALCLAERSKTVHFNGDTVIRQYKNARLTDIEARYYTNTNTK